LCAVQIRIIIDFSLFLIILLLGVSVSLKKKDLSSSLNDNVFKLTGILLRELETCRLLSNLLKRAV